jgi:hypothetical protein
MRGREMSEIKGKVSIPNGYFLKMAQHDYEDYKTALPREFYQNSIDAGAKSIRVSVKDEEVIIEDDGCGMTMDILMNKLLVLGGSHKAEGSVGAFGKAKELLFFSWESYTIRTGNILVEGTGADYSITEMQDSIKGTTCKIKVTDDELPIYNFRNVATKMQTKAKIYINDKLVECDRKRGSHSHRVEDIGTIYQAKNVESYYMEVRINGIWIFSRYVGSGLGTLILELDGASVNILTSNRDGFKWEVNQKISLFYKI